MAALGERGIASETLTLHVGAGTFLPVKADDTDDSLGGVAVGAHFKNAEAIPRNPREHAW